MFYGYIILASFIVVFSFIIYLVFDLASSNANSFQDKWVGKTIWLWLPFYALWRLIKDIIMKK